MLILRVFFVLLRLIYYLCSLEINKANMEFEPKGILKIEGSFFVPDYQRGYRWGTSEVELLLNDITENGKQHRQNYYLQPIVVKAIG